ncbi:energy-coupling factor transporter transmembrane component T family protein [Xylocopilactobacillus apicola]|uniref:Energy-coupling factor transporter transmembrane protein EcfT n=1 Tax=Xylocopilactobacillus apicola TaxID=2932184 RepID=A0AAU9D3V1_9LACO|nr:energy-coupling factor transporter transmembrane component T [Xylocopilactobacillus apicola]BDR59511.1 energy-coupling factor transporter transmembrane protein EcfT [Xylocopilactobacillus apicola]
MSKILIGRYLPGNSIIHRLDPRGKMVFTILFIMVVFWANNLVTYACLLGFTLLVIRLSKISLSYFFAGMKSFIFLIVLVVVVQMFFTPGGKVYFHWGLIWLTSSGLKSAFYMFLRLLININISTILTLTTSPLLIADSIESLLKPLKLLGVPTQVIGLMISIALRFIPTIADSAQKIINAQMSRGVDFNDSSLKKRILNIIPLLVPLLESNFKMAEDLAVAMESRGYIPEAKRTKYRIMRWHLADTASYIILGVITILTWVLKS